jgi:hypothetical protein
MAKKQDDNLKYIYFLKTYAANIERLRKVGIRVMGVNPGYLVCVEDSKSLKAYDLRDDFVEIVCNLIKKVYPETQDDEKMIQLYKDHQVSKDKV